MNNAQRVEYEPNAEHLVSGFATIEHAGQHYTKHGYYYRHAATGKVVFYSDEPLPWGHYHEPEQVKAFTRDSGHADQSRLDAYKNRLRQALATQVGGREINTALDKIADLMDLKFRYEVLVRTKIEVDAIDEADAERQAARLASTGEVLTVRRVEEEP